MPGKDTIFSYFFLMLTLKPVSYGSKKLDFGETLKDSIAIGVSVRSSGLMARYDLDTLYQCRDHNRHHLLPTQLAKGEIVNPGHFRQYRRCMGGTFITMGLMIFPPIFIGVLFMVIPACALRSHGRSPTIPH